MELTLGAFKIIKKPRLYLEEVYQINSKVVKLFYRNIF